MLEHSEFGEIVPGVGLGSVHLGMNRADVRARFGEPLIEIDADADGDSSFEYPGRVCLFFYAERGFRLSLILIEAVEELTLFGQAVGASPLNLSCLGLVEGTAQDDEFVDDESVVRLEREYGFPQSGISFYVDGQGFLTGCAIFVVIGADDGFRWPDASGAKIEGSTPVREDEG